MQMKKFSPVVIIGGGIFLIIMFLQLIFLPLQSQILEMRMETAHLQAVEKTLRKFESQQENFEDFAELTRENLIELQKLLPEKSAQEEFTAEIYKAAEKNKIAVTFLQVGDLVAEENFQKQSVKIKLEGDFISVLNFLRDISDGERFAKLENITLENSEENFIICNAEFFIFALKID